MHHCTKFYQNGKTVVEMTHLTFFKKWWPSAILNLWGKIWDDLQRVFGGLYGLYQNLVGIASVVFII